MIPCFIFTEKLAGRFDLLLLDKLVSGFGKLLGDLFRGDSGYCSYKLDIIRCDL